MMRRREVGKDDNTDTTFKINLLTKDNTPDWRFYFGNINTLEETMIISIML